eukprot:c966_g1_i2.p1 GENE.c966_g1_i2~~c966_g1_i2.p1  ORF type:complete len:227 (+),score=27.70 c966_g1_i2:131-811(+)
MLRCVQSAVKMLQPSQGAAPPVEKNLIILWSTSHFQKAQHLLKTRQLSLKPPRFTFSQTHTFFVHTQHTHKHYVDVQVVNCTGRVPPKSNLLDFAVGEPTPLSRPFWKRRAMLLICTSLVFQGFFFADCQSTRPCLCNTKPFSDSFTCADLCSCISDNCSATSWNSTQTSQCNTINTDHAEACRANIQLTCRWGVSTVLFLIGIVLSLCCSLIVIVRCCRRCRSNE